MPWRAEGDRRPVRSCLRGLGRRESAGQLLGCSVEGSGTGAAVRLAVRIASNRRLPKGALHVMTLERSRWGINKATSHNGAADANKSVPPEN